MPSSDCGDYFIGIGGPGEGLRFGIVFENEAIDGGLQVDHGHEDAALQAALGELGEEALDGVEPGSRSRGEVEGVPVANPILLAVDRESGDAAARCWICAD